MGGFMMVGMFVATVLIMFIAFEGGYRLAAGHRRMEREKEAAVSAISGAILGLTAFMLAFTFGMVIDRYNVRKELVRQEANAIGTAYLRSEILPPSECARAKKLLREYLDYRLQAAHSREHILMKRNKEESQAIHQELWNIVLTNARRDMNSEIGALFMRSINDVIDIHALRVAVVQGHMPTALWSVLYFLVFLGMMTVGYHAAIAGSGRSWVILILVCAFSVVIVLIASLDQPQSGVVQVSQQPLIDLRTSME